MINACTKKWLQCLWPATLVLFLSARQWECRWCGVQGRQVLLRQRAIEGWHFWCRVFLHLQAVRCADFFFFNANSRRQEPHQYFVTNSLEIKLCTRLNDWKICAGHIPGILRHGCSKEAVFMVLSALSYGHSTVLWLMGHLAVYNRAAFTAGNWHIHFIWKYWKLF